VAARSESAATSHKEDKADSAPRPAEQDFGDYAKVNDEYKLVFGALMHVDELLYIKGSLLRCVEQDPDNIYSGSREQ
jgi:hypothetical protein